MDLQGKLVQKGDVQNISEKFKKRDFAIEIQKEHNGSTWVEYAAFQLTQDKTSKLDEFNIGDFISVDFNVKGNKYEKGGVTRYFNNLDAWKLEKVEGGVVASNDVAGDLPF